MESFLACGYGRLKGYPSFVIIQMTLNFETTPIFISLVKLVKFKAKSRKDNIQNSKFKKS